MISSTVRNNGKAWESNKLSPMEIKKHTVTGKRIRDARKEKGMSQATLADKLGVEPSTVGNYETGLRYPPPEQMKKLAKELDVPASFLADTEWDKQIEVLALLFSKLDKRGKDTVLSVAQSQSANPEPTSKIKSA